MRRRSGRIEGRWSKYPLMHGRTDRIKNRWWIVVHTSALGSANARVEWAEANICVLHVDLVKSVFARTAMS